MIPRRFRLAIFNYNLPADGRKRGGVDSAAHTLAEGLARRGHRVVVFCHDARPPGAAYDVAPLPWRAFVDTWLGRRMTMGYLGNLLAVLPDYRRFDAVVMHGDSLLAPVCGRPVLRVMHGSALGEARSATSVGRRVLQAGVYVQELLTAAMQDGVVGVSANTLRDNPFIRRCIPHGVDDTLFHPAPGDRSAEPSVLFVGTMDGRKRGAFLLDAFVSRVLPEHPSATLTVVGPPGPAHPCVRYRTGVDGRTLAALYRRAWVYASPSTYEGFGLPYLEAMASGTPVVATPNAGSLEVFGGGACGLLAGDGDFGASVAALLGDAGRRARLSAAGLTRARAYSLVRMLDAYEDLLSELIDGRVRFSAAA